MGFSPRDVDEMSLGQFIAAARDPTQAAGLSAAEIDDIGRLLDRAEMTVH